MRALIMFLAAAVVLFPLTASATIINIPGDYPTIQQGIDHGQDGDTVLVQPGTYYENLNFNGHNVVLGSLFLVTGDPAYISSTKIDGRQDGPVIEFENREDSTAQVVGFTIQNGYSGWLRYGGGIRCKRSRPTIRNNIISDNSADRAGGGIYCAYSRATISNNTISGNSAPAGGGICLNASRATISNNTITGNNNGLYGRGGGILCFDGSSATISNNAITGNWAGEYGCGGGIHCTNSSAKITDNTISGNSIGYYGGGAGICYFSSNPTISNNIISGNWTGDNSQGGVFIAALPTPL